jgi:hypothetical protein
MMHTRRGTLSAAQRAEVWNRWKAGQSLHAIGRALGKAHVVIRFLLVRHGGIAPPCVKVHSNGGTNSSYRTRSYQFRLPAAAFGWP